MRFLRNLLALLALLIGIAAFASPPALAQSEGQPRVLLFSHTTGFRHPSIEAGVAAIQALGAREGLTIVHSEDPAVFSEAGLAGIDAIVFLSTTTNPRNPDSEWFQGARREALQRFVRRGGGVVAIHGAADSHYNWPWYQQLIGGHFVRHPSGTPEGALQVIDKGHVATRGVDASLRLVDEWYYFDDYDPRMTLLITLDPASIGEPDANPNPVSWAHEFDGGRAFYTAMGHTAESYAEKNFLNHLAGGLAWVLKQE